MTATQTLTLADAMARAQAEIARGDFAAAEQVCVAILTASPDQPEAMLLLAMARHGGGALEASLGAYDATLALRPAWPEALNNRGLALQQLGRTEEAAESYERVLALRPDFVDALINLGMAHRLSGRAAVALTYCDRALALRPDSAVAHFNRGVAFEQLEDLEQAANCFERALELNGDLLEARHALGCALMRQQRGLEALACFEAVLAARPGHVEAANNRGILLQRLGRWQEALASYDGALAADPHHVDTLNNRGAMLQRLGRSEEAISNLAAVLERDPRHVEAINNRGTALRQLGRFAESRAAFDAVLEIQPDFEEARFNRAMLSLLEGRMEEGWRDYEARRRMRDWREWTLPGQEWTGQDLRGKRLLLYFEQGLGDTLQFARFARFLAEAAGEVVLRAQSPINALLRSMGSVTVIDRDEADQDCDYHLPLMSTPFALGHEAPEYIARPGPYLFADPDRVKRWAGRLGGEGLKIGLSWQGNPQVDVDYGRSVPLAAYQPLGQVPGVRLISLQKNAGTEQLDSLPPGMSVETLGPNFDAGPDAFLDTAAVMMSLDLVVTNDTSMAHLAGALGRPVWIMLSSTPDWRWLMERLDSPWYPTARLFRQSRTGEWDAPVASAAAVLARLADEGGRP